MKIDFHEALGGAPQVTRHTVIALHASVSSARQWRPLAERLAQAHTFAQHGPRAVDLHTFDVHAIDLHDHGAGPAWATDGVQRPPLTLADEAALVAPFVLAAGRVGHGSGASASAGGVHLVGHSYGGAVALKVASLYPQHVRSLVVYEPVTFRLLLDDAASHAEAAEALALVAGMQTCVERGDRDGAARRFIDYWSGGGTWQAMPEPARESVVARLPALVQQFGALHNERQQASAIARLAMPTLVLSGERTVPAARRIAERLRALNPAATHETLPGLGHMGPVTHADLVAERIARHLGLPPSPGQAAARPHHVPPPPVPAPRDLSTVV